MLDLLMLIVQLLYILLLNFFDFFFFFQAEDGIRDLYVTGVQTCALPIYSLRVRPIGRTLKEFPPACADGKVVEVKHHGAERSEERRVGKECRSRWSPDQ